MRRLVMVLCFVFTALPVLTQTATPTTASDPVAVSLAQKSIAALTGGLSIADVTLTANVVSTLGSANDPGTAMFEAK